MGATFLQALRACLGNSNVLVDGDLDAYQVDWRKRYRGRALAVARPSSTDEVAAVVGLCARHGVPIVPQGGNTGLVGGGVPDASGQQLVLSLSRMRNVRSIDPDNLTATVEAGCVLQHVRDCVASHGLLFPLSIGSLGSCTIGGNLASNAGGTQVLRYGNARELCLGLEVVTASGDVWDGLSGLRKDNTGYDLRDLFIGSEGTLGIITAATLKLHPQPRATTTALAACNDVAGALALLKRARARFDAGLTGFELMERHALALVARHFPERAQPLPAAAWAVLLEAVGDDQAALETAMQEVLAIADADAPDAVLATSIEQARALWQLREGIPPAQAREGLNIKHDIALPLAAIPDFVRTMGDALQVILPGVRPVVFGHLGDGNLHYNIQAPEGMAPADFLRDWEAEVNRRVLDAVAARGGSFAAEHGIGALKVGELASRKSPVALGMMHAIKQALDPHGLLNPGKLLAPR